MVYFCGIEEAETQLIGSVVEGIHESKKNFEQDDFSGSYQTVLNLALLKFYSFLSIL